MNEKKISPLYKVIKAVVRLIYPKVEVAGAENLPDGPCVIVGNHAQLHGPLACELYFPGERYTWCAGQMMALREVPGYAYQDFWSRKPKRSRWLYKLASYLIAPLSVLLFNNADTIAVYHDRRVLNTFRETVKKLQTGARIIIFPEHDVPNNHILYQFQERFVDVARLYYKRTGQELDFVPMYVAPGLHRLILGEPVRFHGGAPHDEERRRVCDELTARITAMACAQPEHTVVPYRNIPKKQYPKNTFGNEVEQDAQTSC